MESLYDLTSPRDIKFLLEKYGFRFSKSLGQNFIIDRNVISRIVESAKLDENYGVLEIGPGFGVLTRELCKYANKVVSVEIDKDLYPVLDETMQGVSNFELIKSDILKLDLKKVLNERFEGLRVKIVANLPYYITTPIIMGLLESRLEIEEIIVMMQKEVADRIKSKKGSKVYGALSVSVQYFTEVSTVLSVPSGSFMPMPKVDSVVLSLKKRQMPAVSLIDEELFFKTVRSAFGKRRKTLLNSLSSGELNISKQQIKEILIDLELDENLRAESLSMDDFARIANKIGGVYEKNLL